MRIPGIAWAAENCSRQACSRVAYLQNRADKIEALTSGVRQMSEPALFVLIRDGKKSFYVDRWAGAFLFREVPTGFPLKQPPFGLLPELFLTDTERPAGKPIKAR